MRNGLPPTSVTGAEVPGVFPMTFTDKFFHAAVKCVKAAGPEAGLTQSPSAPLTERKRGCRGGPLLAHASDQRRGGSSRRGPAVTPRRPPRLGRCTRRSLRRRRCRVVRRLRYAFVAVRHRLFIASWFDPPPAAMVSCSRVTYDHALPLCHCPTPREAAGRRL